MKKTLFTIISTALVTASLLSPVGAELLGRGFSLRNNTNHTVTVKVGNFFPTPYVLSPHSSQWVFVSSDNQTVKIDSVN